MQPLAGQVNVHIVIITSGKNSELLLYDQIWELTNDIQETTAQGKPSTEGERMSLKTDLQKLNFKVDEEI